MKIQALAGLIGERERQVIHAVVDEISAKAPSGKAFELMPITNVPDSLLIHERISAAGGKTQERARNAAGKSVPAQSSNSRYFDPGAYQESINFFERELLRLRKFGTMGERGVTGLTSGQLDHLTLAGMKLQKRLVNRMTGLVWDSIFNGKYTYQGVDFSFDVPSGNAFTAATDWADAVNSKPFPDLFNLIYLNPVLLKYKIKEILVNPTTAAAMLNSNDTKTFIQNYNISKNDLNVVAQFVRPGLPPITVVDDVWQDESLAADGSISVANAQFFFPDYKVLLVPDLSATIFPKLGEMQICENLNDPAASLQQPAVGVYTFVDEKGLEERKNPHVSVVSGFNGAPNLLRSNDVLTVAVH